MNRTHAVLLSLFLLPPGAVHAEALPEGAVRRLGTTSFRLGTGDESVLAYSPDGKVLAVSNGAVIHLFDAETGAERRRLVGPSMFPIHALGFSSDGLTLVARHVRQDGGRVRTNLWLWSLKPGGPPQGTSADTDAAAPTINAKDLWKQLHDDEAPPLKEWGVSPDSQFLATTNGHMVSVRKFLDGREIGSFYSVRVPTALAVLPGGKRVAVGRDDGTIRIHNVATGIGQRDLGTRGKHAVTSIALSPDGALLAATLGGDRPVPLWKLADNAPPIELQADDACEVVFTRDGKSLTATSTEGTHRIFAAASGKLLRTVDFKRPAPTGLAPDGQTLAWIDGRVVHRLDTATGKDRPLAHGHAESVGVVTFSRDGKSVTGRHGAVCLTWDSATGKLLNTRTSDEPEPDPSISPDGRLQLIELNRLLVCSMPRGEPIVHLQKFSFGFGVFSPDAQWVVMLSRGSANPEMFDVVTGCSLGEFPVWATPAKDEHNQERYKTRPAFALSPDKRMAAFAVPFGDIHVFDVPTRQRLCRFPGHAGWNVTSLAFSPDARLLASGSDDTSILLWGLGPTEKSKELNAARLAALWSALASDDARIIHDAASILRDQPKASVPFLRAQLRKDIDLERMRQRIAQLDDDQFVVRQKAEVELDEVREFAAPLLRETLQGPLPSLEWRRRVERILARVDPANLSLAGRRAQRAVAVLEYIGTAEAKGALAALRTVQPRGLMGRALQDAERRLAGKPAPSPFVAAFADDRPEVRVCAARGLALLGDTSDEIIDLLANAVADPAVRVRLQTIEILAQARLGHKPIVAALARAHDDPTPEVAIAAFDALLARGRLDDAALRKSAQDHPNEAIRRHAAEIIREQEEAEIAIRKAAEENRIMDIRLRAAEAMREQEKAKLHRMRFEPLLQRMRGMDDRKGYAAAEALAKRESETMPALIKLMAEDNPRARERAAFALGHMGAVARDATPELLKALRDKEIPVRRRSAEALAQIVPYSDKETIAGLLAALKDDDAEVRLHLTEALGKLGRTGIPPLIEALKDTNARVRLGAAEALGNIDPKATRALPALREARRDADPTVRKAAEEAIVNIERGG